VKEWLARHDKRRAVNTHNLPIAQEAIGAISAVVVQQTARTVVQTALGKVYVYLLLLGRTLGVGGPLTVSLGSGVAARFWFWGASS